MLKRFTKVTSLLIAAASVVSMVPVMAADVKTIDAQEGTVYQGDAKGDGVFYIGGEINGEEAGYYVADNKYTKVDGIETGDSVGKTYKNEYLEFQDGDYYLDYKTGKKIDDSIGDDVIDDAASAVRKNIKNDNDGRFTDAAVNAIATAQPKRYGAGTREVFFDGPFGAWSHYQYDLKTASLNGQTKSTIYADTEGKYIDGDYSLGDLKVYSTGASVTIKNTKDTYELKGTDGNTYEFKAAIKENAVLTEGYADIFRVADLSIYSRQKGVGSYQDVTSTVKFGGQNGHKAVSNNINGDGSVRVLEKLSKEQASDDVDGIKYPKSANIYFLTDENGTYESLFGIYDPSRGDHTPLFTTSAKCITSAYVDNSNNKLYGQTVTLKNKNGYSYVDLSDSDSTDIENKDAWAIGGGDLYCLSNGYIKDWDGKESFEKIYKVDGAMSKIKASDKNNILVWSDEASNSNNVYSVISNKVPSGDKTTTDTKTTEAAKAGWTKTADGTWTFVNTDGTAVKGWKQDGTVWYYLDPTTGVMATGWKNVGNTWYYLNASGAMQTGWINDNGTWYYCNASGAMLANTTVDGYVVGANGAWVK